MKGFDIFFDERNDGQGNICYRKAHKVHCSHWRCDIRNRKGCYWYGIISLRPASSTGLLLRTLGLSVTSIKIDPYLNIDAGTLTPLDHGEVFVLDDGGEVDLDLGNYERFLDVTLTRDNNITTGKIYKQVIEREVSPRYFLPSSAPWRLSGKDCSSCTAHYQCNPRLGRARRSNSCKQ